MKATAAMRSIGHLARNQVDWFPFRGSMLEVRPPVWILRTETFEPDMRVLLDRLGITTEVSLADDAVLSHSFDYADVPALSGSRFTT